MKLRKKNQKEKQGNKQLKNIKQKNNEEDLLSHQTKNFKKLILILP